MCAEIIVADRLQLSSNLFWILVVRFFFGEFNQSIMLAKLTTEISPCSAAIRFLISESKALPE